MEADFVEQLANKFPNSPGNGVGEPCTSLSSAAWCGNDGSLWFDFWSWFMLKNVGIAAAGVAIGVPVWGIALAVGGTVALAAQLIVR